jgi:anti-sigma B factor antagonist
MEIKVSRNDDNIYLVKLSGEMDLCSSELLKEVIMKIVINKTDRIIVDLEKIESINSTGIGALITIFSTLKKLKCRLVIIAGRGPAVNALESSRLKGYFSIANSLKEALSL